MTTMCRIGLVVVIIYLVCVEDSVNADILDSPYMAAVLLREWETSEFKFQCNGAIISSNHVLTTATCVSDTFSYAGNIKVRVGSSFHYRGGQIHPVERVRKHLKFSPDLDADIAVLTLSQPLKLSYRVAVVNLPEQNAVKHNWKNAKVTDYRGGTPSDVSYNSLDKLVDLNYITTHVCNNHFKRDPPFDDLVTENMICVGLFVTPFVSRGAPLVFNGTVYGIYSWDRTSSTSPSVFTRVSAFSNWIKNGETFDYGNIKVGVGSSRHPYGGQERFVENVNKHFKFRPDLDADIAVLTLSHPLKLSHRVAVVNLPEQNSSPEEIYPSSIAYYMSDVLPGVTFESLQGAAVSEYHDSLKCKDSLKAYLPHEELVTENMICLQFHSFLPVHIFGTPWVVNGIIHGIHSWDRRTNNRHQYIFTKVAAFTDWIKNSIR